MRKFIIVLVLLAGFVGACAKVQATESTVAASPTAEPTAVPTAPPEPTETLPPVPTDVLTPTATTAPTLIEIGQQIPGCGEDGARVSESKMDRYLSSLEGWVYGVYPELSGSEWVSIASVVISTENPNPFSILDSIVGENGWKSWEVCDGYVLFLKNVPENQDRDGILEGEARLFFDNGPRLFELDGELVGTNFDFPPVIRSDDEPISEN